MATLSISKAWDESKDIMARDGRLIGAVALALVAFPGAISGLVTPHGFNDPAAPVWARVTTIIATLIEVAGQLALIRLALGPSTTVGSAIAHGLRRTPIYVVAALIITCGLIILCVPFAAILMSAGVPLTAEGIRQSPIAALLALIYLVIITFFAIRLMVSSCVASAESAGPIAIIRRSWELTSGHWWRLFGFIVTFLVGAIVLIAAVGAAVGVAVGITLGKPDPLSASALVIALIISLLDAAITALLAVMLARIYVQLSGHSSVAGASKRGI
jgi:hypothetical protein